MPPSGPIFVSPFRAASGSPSGVVTHDGFPANTDRTHERIVARIGGSRATRYRFLPWLDDLNGETQEHLDAYMEMFRRDDCVRAAVLTKVWSLASLDWQTHAASDKPRDKMIADFILHAYQNAEGGTAQLVEELAIPLVVRKYVIAEKVISNDVYEYGRWKGYRGLRALKAREWATIEEDTYGNITGVVGPGEGGAQQWNDPRDFIIIKNLSVFGTPSSDLRPVYRWFVAKDTLIKLWLIGLEKFGNPYVIGKYLAGDDEARTGLEAGLETLRGRTYAVVPDGTSIEFANALASSANFESALDRCDRGIQTSVNLAFLQSMTSNTSGDRGNALVQKDTSELPVWRLAKVIEAALHTQCSPYLVNLNFERAETPRVTLGAVNERDLLQAAQLDNLLLNQLKLDLSKDDRAKFYARKLASDPSDSLLAKVQPPGGGLAGLFGGGGFGGGSPDGGGGMGAPQDEPPPRPRPMQPPGPRQLPPPRQPATSPDEQFADVDATATDPAVATAGIAAGLAGDAEAAAKLLAEAQSEATAILADITGDAVSRLIARGPGAIQRASGLYTDAELAELAGILRDTIAPAQLLGRATILARADQAEQHYAERRGQRGSRRGAGSDVHRKTMRLFSDCGDKSQTWKKFSQASGSLGIPRKKMPQVKSEHRGALARFLRSRGIEYERDEVNPASLKPSQAEFCVEKVGKALEHSGNRPILVSEDGYVVDGHHQWLAALMSDPEEPMRVTVLHAPIREVLDAVLEFPSCETHAFSDASRRASQPLRFSAIPTDLHRFNQGDGGGDDAASWIEPMPPEQALDYFRRLEPRLGVNPRRFGAEAERTAFTLAVATEETLLARVQELIAQRIESGRGISTAPQDVEEILAELGVSPENAQYAEMVIRTNMMDAYNTGAQRQLSDSSEMFPVWQYSNPDDGRSRPGHAKRNRRYYPSSVPFARVRGTEIGDVANCRCTPIPIDKFEWADLVAGGAKLEKGGW